MNNLCSKCNTKPRAQNQSYCRQCYNAYMREYRRRKGFTQVARSTLAAGEIPDSVKTRLIRNGNRWAVIVSNGRHWEAIYRSQDKDECLLCLGSVFGYNLRR